MNTFAAFLLWVELLLALLLSMAAVYAWTARWSSGLGRIVVRTIFTLACLMPLLGFLGLSITLTMIQIVHNALMFSASLTAAYCVGEIVLGRINRVRLAQWPMMRLWIASLGAMSLTGITVWTMDVNARLWMQIARADAAALAVSVAPPMVPDEQNAAVIYSTVAEVLKDEKIKNACEALYRGDTPETPLDIAQMAIHVDQLQGVIGSIEQAARRPYCRFDHPYSRPGLSLLLPELSSFRHMANLLGYSARVAAYRGQPEQALQQISLIYRMQEHSSNSPCLVSGLLAIGLGGLADDAVLGVLPAVTDARQLSALLLPAEDGLVRIMDRALVSEESFGVAAMIETAENPRSAQRLYNSDESVWTSLVAVSGIVLSRLHSWPYELDAYHQNAQLTRNLSNTPVYQWKETEAELLKRALSGKGQGTLTSIFLPSLIRSAQRTSEAQAFRRMAQMALAATRYRLERGHYPTTADELVPAYLPAVPIDPFDGKPLRMKSEVDGLLFYSVGMDRTDDGGQEIRTADRITHDDVMRLKTPEAFRRAATTRP